jgi:hypothetical protein
MVRAPGPFDDMCGHSIGRRELLIAEVGADRIAAMS